MKRSLPLLIIGAFFSLDLLGETARISGLEWKMGPTQIVREVSVGTFMIEVGGYYLRPSWKLYLSNYEVPLKENGEFSLLVPVDLNYFRLEFNARGPNGEIEKESYKVSLNRFFPMSNQRRKPRKWYERELQNASLSMGLGTSFLSHEQASFEPFSQTNLNTRAEFIYLIDPGIWVFEANGFVSLLSFGKAERAESAMKIAGGDIRLGYEVPFLERTWSFFIFGGVYGLTSFGSTSVGYDGIAGPELFPAIRHVFTDGSSLGVYFKYSPVMSGLSLMDANNSYIAAGTSYYLKPFSRGSFRGMPLGISVEASRLRLAVTRGDVVTTNYTVSLNVMF